MGHFEFESDVIAEESGLTIIQKDHPDCIVLKTREEKNNRSLDWFDRLEYNIWSKCGNTKYRTIYSRFENR